MLQSALMDPWRLAWFCGLSSSSFAVDTMHEDAERKGRPQGAQLEGRPQLDVVLIFLITFVPHAAPDVGILDLKL